MVGFYFYPIICRSGKPRIYNGLTEILWLRILLTEIGFSPSQKNQLFCDKALSESRKINRTRHVAVNRRG